jgi:Rhodopirellula transposase DDE domain
MPRPNSQPKPFWREFTKCWHVQIGKKQVRLDPDQEKAYQLYHEIMARKPEAALEAIPAAGQLVVQVLDAFLDWVKANKAEKTYTRHKNHIQAFCDGIPNTLTIDQLNPSTSPGSWQANRKTKEGQDHPDRDAQFEYINQQVTAFHRAGQPVVSVDAKKKELNGDFRNPARVASPRPSGGGPRQGHPGQATGQGHPRRSL